MADIELLDAIAVLSESDVPSSLAFYRDKLGFDTDFAMAGYPYAGVRRGRMALHLDGATHEFAHRPDTASTFEASTSSTASSSPAAS
jgi:catechol 2,3-dioxygenase-like lactoylglutathione lyase family enzyme